MAPKVVEGNIEIFEVVCALQVVTYVVHSYRRQAHFDQPQLLQIYIFGGQELNQLIDILVLSLAAN